MKKIIVALMAIASSCLLLCTPVLADYREDGFSVKTITDETVNGGVFIDYEPWASTKTLTGDFDVPEGDIEWARLYTGIWGGTENYAGWVTVTFNGVDDENGLGPIHLQGESDTNRNVWCSGNGKHWMYYDVTDLVDAGSTNTATVSKINATDPQGNFDGRVYAIVLVAVYEGGDDPKDIQYWINDGSDGLNYNIDHDDGTTYFEGTVDTGSVEDAKLTMVHLTAYDPGCASCLKFNGHELDTSMVDSNTFDLNTWDVTDYMETEENSAWYSRGDDGYVSITNAILVVERGAEEESVEVPDLIPTAIKPYHYKWLEEENRPKGNPWFNLMNYVNVTVENCGNAEVESFELKLYADDTLIGREIVEGLPAGESKDVKFEWMPGGEDTLSWTDTPEGAKLAYIDTSKTYMLKAVVDESNEILEENKANNELIKDQNVVWNGFAGDESLRNYVQGKVKGGIIYTTGNGQYQGVESAGTKYDTYYDVNHNIAIPGSTELARLYIYYTWAQPAYKAPKIGVTLQTPAKASYSLSMEKSYNDIKGDFGPWRYTWGMYAYDITEYLNESGIYTVSVTNLNAGSDSDFATEYAIAAPAILVVYEDSKEPEREYWINEGADILIGGRRSDGGFLALNECKNTALFPGSIDLDGIEEATLGVVSPWGDSSKDDVLYFNDEELGEGVYCGYNSPCSKEIDGISMHIGASSAQVGIAAIVVTSYLDEDKNTVIQGDDGDNMMPSNAFLVISYPSTATQIPTPTTTPTSTVTVTPSLTPASTPTSTPTEEKEATESPVPGFEFLISLFMLMVVAYLIRRREGVK